MRCCIDGTAALSYFRLVFTSCSGTIETGTLFLFSNSYAFDLVRTSELQSGQDDQGKENARHLLTSSRLMLKLIRRLLVSNWQQLTKLKLRVETASEHSSEMLSIKLQGRHVEGYLALNNKK